MGKLILAFLLAVTVTALLYRKSEKPVTTPSKSERVTEISSSELITIKEEKLYEISPAAKGPPTRVTLTQEEKKIIKGSTRNHFDKDTLVLLAEIASPVYRGQTLQASDIFINRNQNKKTKIYISYNMRGEPFLGAVQILDVSEKGETGATPELKQTVIFNDFDIHSLMEKKGILYLVGGTSDERFKTPAALEMIELKNGLIPIPLSSKRIDLPSFAATSVIKVKGKILVASGDQGGGVTAIANPYASIKEFAHYWDLDHTFYDLDDARYLAYDGDMIYGVKGTNTALWMMERSSRAPAPKIMGVKGGSIPESKSMVTLTDQHVLLALGDGGTQIRDRKSLEVLHHIPQAEYSDTGGLHADNSLTVTNGVSGHFKEIYTADGEAGARVFDFTDKGALNQVASINFGPGISVNAIKYYDGFLIMASGLGGVKMAKLFRADQKISDDEHRHYLKFEERDVDDD